MADGSNSLVEKLHLSRDEARDVAALVLARAQSRLLEASHEFQDIVAELEWRLRDYLQLVRKARVSRRACLAAEKVIHQRNAEAMRLHAEINDLEARVRTFGSWMGGDAPASAAPALTPDLMGLLFSRLYGSSQTAADVANWPTLAAAILRVYQRRARKTGHGLAQDFNQLGEA